MKSQELSTVKEIRRIVLVGPVVPAGQKAWLKKTIQSLKLGPTDFVIAVDGGLDVCLALKLKPDFAVGDWDSLSRRARPILKSILHLDLPRSKNESDLKWALQWILFLAGRSSRLKQVLLFGVSGGRKDHQLAMLFEVAGFSKRLSRISQGEALVEVTSAEDRFILVTPQSNARTLRLPMGCVVSVFSLLGVSRGVNLDGFEYRLF